MSAWLEAAFAAHRPRALAALTRMFRDIDLAEDAFADACVKALAEWPAGDGPPRDPLAWLLRVARNAALDRLRTVARRQRLLALDGDLLMPPAPDDWEPPDPSALSDDVLRLMFMCCHPALTRQDQLALALKVVAGLRTEQVAAAFVLKPRTMEQRLTRAKRTIVQNPVPFDPPSQQERLHRLGEVTLMVYLMFNEGWSAVAGPASARPALTVEAIRLARLLVGLFPAETEVQALLALLLYQDARFESRFDGEGQLLTLDAQDRSLWNRGAIAEADSLMQKVERSPNTGPYRLQAAISAAHARARRAEDTDWPLIEALYATLYRLHPTPVIKLNHIAARARSEGAAVALAEMEPLEGTLRGYRWFHTMRAALLREVGAPAEAVAAFEAALALGPTDPERRAIERDIANLTAVSPLSKDPNHARI